MSPKPRVVLPKLLMEHGLADMQTLGMATGIAAEGDVSLAHAIIRWRLVPAAGLCAALAKALDMEPAHPSADRAVAQLVRRAQCARLRVLPIWQRAGVLGLAMTDPTDDAAAAAIAQHTAFKIERVLIDDDELERAIRRAFDDNAAREDADELSTVPMPKAPAPASQSMSVVLGEPSLFDARIEEANSEMFVDPVSLPEGEFMHEPSGVFTNRTIDMPMTRGALVSDVGLTRATRPPPRSVPTVPPPIGQEVISATPTPPALPDSSGKSSPRLVTNGGAEAPERRVNDITGPVPSRPTVVDGMLDEHTRVSTSKTRRGSWRGLSRSRSRRPSLGRSRWCKHRRPTIAPCRATTCSS
jgi:hypothetical protein